MHSLRQLEMMTGQLTWTVTFTYCLDEQAALLTVRRRNLILYLQGPRAPRTLYFTKSDRGNQLKLYLIYSRCERATCRSIVAVRAEDSTQLVSCRESQSAGGNQHV
jgi:hypothetical protein